jgi:hypothetical protein
LQSELFPWACVGPSRYLALGARPAARTPTASMPKFVTAAPRSIVARRFVECHPRRMPVDHLPIYRRRRSRMRTASASDMPRARSNTTKW